jgi:oligopeptidase B
MADQPVPPVARKVPCRITQLGRVREDDYAWMKDANWQALLRDPTLLRADIRDHLVAENGYTEAMLASTKALQAEILAEMTGRIKQDDASVPVPDGAWEYYNRYEIGAQHPLYARRPCGAADGEEILLDAEAQAKGHDFFHIAAARHSPDHRLFAYAEDSQGSKAYRIREGLGKRGGAGGQHRECDRQLRLFGGLALAILDIPERERSALPRLSQARSRR